MATMQVTSVRLYIDTNVDASLFLNYDLSNDIKSLKSEFDTDAFGFRFFFSTYTLRWGPPQESIDTKAQSNGVLLKCRGNRKTAATIAA